MQLRIDLGILQMEMTGRPDGQRPHNCESLLVYHQRRAERAEARGETYELTPSNATSSSRKAFSITTATSAFFRSTISPA